jgi:predicted  nucleic acid-binding Zn-ribbon protein
MPKKKLDMLPWWEVQQVSFIAGARSLNEESLRKNRQAFNIPQKVVESIRSKLSKKIFDEYANIIGAY